MACSGSMFQFCGDSWRMNVYSVTAELPLTSFPVGSCGSLFDYTLSAVIKQDKAQINIGNELDEHPLLIEDYGTTVFGMKASSMITSPGCSMTVYTEEWANRIGGSRLICSNVGGTQVKGCNFSNRFFFQNKIKSSNCICQKKNKAVGCFNTLKFRLKYDRFNPHTLEG